MAIRIRNLMINRDDRIRPERVNAILLRKICSYVVRLIASVEPSRSSLLIFSLAKTSFFVALGKSLAKVFVC
jgi:hypothetical protein